MADRNIQIKIRNGEDWDNLFPKTKSDLVEGLTDALNEKVDKVDGKGLSSEDFTTSEKQKLAGIEDGANNYTHPSTHPASIIVENSSKRFVSDADKAAWNAKEDASNKGKANGYAGLDANGKVPLSQLPDPAKSQTFVVTNSLERDALDGVLPGDKCYETDSGDSFIYTDTGWQILAKADWENVNLDWNNIINAPSSPQGDIDDAVSKRHTHSNRDILEKIVDSGGSATYDLADFVTQDQISDMGNGDMLKSVYDSDNDGKVDAAEQADSVPWDGITGKPVTFQPSAHDHVASEILESSSRRFVSDSEKDVWNGKSKIVISATEPTGADLWFQEV